MPLYLAMTAVELSACKALPPRLAYMACHFSPYSTGLSNLPKDLPKESILILNDRIPVCGHDPDTVACQLASVCTALEVNSLLLDLQRPYDDHLRTIVEAILSKAVCPVAVSELYAKDLDCPVFTTVPLNVPLSVHIKPWEGREIWLEAALEETTYAITKDASFPVYETAEAPLPCPELCCHYGFREKEDRLILSMVRTWEDLQELIHDNHIKKAIGLYQQLGKEKGRFPEETAPCHQNLPPPPP